ncbi:hypothetical protein ACIOZM_30650 [Pseudomonas sp. NPDC087346]|uniref:hypothetical protein n=1 Tax=Pseudomonas sp. NPDC087346 TaxID=3364438 RepID=UPI0037F7BFBB
MTITADGNVACLSSDGRSCAWGQPSLSASQTITPLVCGAMHNSIYGVSGYTSNHWCSQVYAQFYARWNDGTIADADTLYSISPTGDIMCFSSDGKFCAWGNRNPTNTQKSTVQPLICGEMHKTLYESTGYTGDQWCKRLYDKVAYKLPTFSPNATENYTATQDTKTTIEIPNVYLPTNLYTMNAKIIINNRKPIYCIVNNQSSTTTTRPATLSITCPIPDIEKNVLYGKVVIEYAPGQQLFGYRGNIRLDPAYN